VELGDRFDALGIGAVAIDDVLVVASYPAAETKARVLARERHHGGLCGTALAAAARLGSRCAYAGVLGLDSLSDAVVENFVHLGIDVSALRRRAGVGPILSTIIIGRDDGTRTVLSDRNGFTGPDPDWPPADLIRTARVLLVDHIGGRGIVRAAEIARAAGRAVVADLERTLDDSDDFRRLFDLTDHLIVGRLFAAQLTGLSDPAAAARALWHAGCSAVVVTAGAAGCWAVSGPASCFLHHQPAFSVPVVDTTGCGDVFHGAYASALARGGSLPDRLCEASAAAALKARRGGGQGGIPDRAAIGEFLEKQINQSLLD
jgi:sugar/nucleoside kinase (ribokinase family)